ncbi:MAG: hypothetical protein A2138_26850 [Deltaproteobacteria bacterium RBG_16_71_12]|nr:MAG: hypothetical protein A2138_26850 [Deltaproteobacteria bacterium RBG_16_71_12]
MVPPRKAKRGGLAALACALAALSAAACQPQLTLVLVRAEDLAATPPFVKLLIRQLDERQADVFGPFEVHSFPDEQLAPVPPGSPFYVDVIGCQTGAAEECAETTSFVARGCSDVLTLEKDSAVVVEIQVHSAATGADLCPPEAPGS